MRGFFPAALFLALFSISAFAQTEDPSVAPAEPMEAGQIQNPASVPAQAEEEPSPFPPSEEDNYCNAYPTVPVLVIPTWEETGFDHGTSIGGLRSLASSTPHFPERLLLGVTTYKPAVSTKSYTRSITEPDGTSCIKITGVVIKIDIQDMVVHMASEIPQNSCGYNEVLRHGEKHVAVNRALLEEYVPIIQQKLQAYLKNAGYIEQRDYGYSMKVLYERLKELVSESLREMSREEFERQKDVDSPEEFQRMTRACNGELGKIAAQFRQNDNR